MFGKISERTVYRVTFWILVICPETSGYICIQIIVWHSTLAGLEKLERGINDTNLGLWILLHTRMLIRHMTISQIGNY
jgi:hypothetical protein